VKICIIQPAYLPWLGYFERMQLCDRVVMLNHVDIDKNSKTKFVNRNKIRTPQGWTWLVVPINTSSLSGELKINKIKVAPGTEWAQKHCKTISANYSRSPFYSEKYKLLESHLKQNHQLIEQVNYPLINLLCEWLGIKSEIIKSSDLNCQSRKDDLILEICKKLGARTYLSGPFGRDYLTSQKFQEAGIEIQYHEYEVIEYNQAWPGFEPNMSAVDLIFNYGPEAPSFINGKRLQTLKMEKNITKEKLCLVPAAESDLAELIIMANEKEVRENSFKSSIIKFEDHIKWFNKIKSEKTAAIYMLKTDADIFLGQIRFEKKQEYFEIDISLKKSVRSQGIGKILLQTGMIQFKKDFGQSRFIANVKAHNTKAIALFRSLFFNENHEKSHIVFKKIL